MDLAGTRGMSAQFQNRRLGGADRTVRRHPAQTAQESGHHRPPASTARTPEGDHHPAPARRMRMVPRPDHDGNPPGPKARRPGKTRPGAGRLGGPDGENAAQDPHRLRTPATRPSTTGSQPRTARENRWRAGCVERHPSGSDRGPPEKDLNHRHLADGLPVYPRFPQTQRDLRRLSQRSDLRGPDLVRLPQTKPRCIACRK